MLWTVANYNQVVIPVKGIFPTAWLTLHSWAMAFWCYFQRIIGADCSFDRLDESKSLEIVTLRKCSKDISNHCSHWSFSGLTMESEQILTKLAETRHNLPTPQTWTRTWLAAKPFQVSRRESDPNMEEIEKWFEEFRKGYRSTFWSRLGSYFFQLDQVSYVPGAIDPLQKWLL